jgi:hypothetical protein
MLLAIPAAVLLALAAGCTVDTRAAAEKQPAAPPAEAPEPAAAPKPAAASPQPAPRPAPADVTLQTYLLQEQSFPAQQGEKPWCMLGGADGAMAVLDFNIPLLKRLTVRPDDLRKVLLRMKVSKSSGDLAGAKLHFHRVLRALPARGEPKAMDDYAVRPIVSAPLAGAIKDGWLEMAGFAGPLAKWVSGEWADHGILVWVEGDGEPLLRLHGLTSPGSGYWQRNLPHLMVTLRGRENHFLYDWDVRPRSGVYARRQDGRLHYGGKRLRLWGVCRGASHNARQCLRVKKMGFNAIRLWAGGDLYTAESARRGEPAATDHMERYDKYVAEMKKAGMWIMCPTLTGLGGFKRLLKADSLLADDSWLRPLGGGEKDWAAWKQAMTADLKGVRRKSLEYFDERLIALRRRLARDYLDHVNPYTQKRYAEEECIAIHEIANENGFLKFQLERGFGAWPAYFRDKLRRRWNAYLAERYRDDDGLTKAWGKLADGETLTGAKVALEPVRGSRGKYPKQRASDFVRFCIELVDGFNQSFTAYCRKQAPKGVGVNVAPFSFDAQYRGNTPWHYTMYRGDCISQNMYYHTMQTYLSRPPGLGLASASAAKDRLYVMTEAGCGRPNPYHVEFPFRLAAFASWQDWDGVFFHYFQEPLWYWKTINPDEQYLLCALPYKFNTADVMVECDPALCSAAGLAGQIFRSFALASAANPAIHRAAAKAIFGYDRWGGVGSGRDAFTRGSRTEYRPDLDVDVTVDGKPPAERPPIREAVASGKEVLWDWPNTRLIVDSPYAHCYVGRPPKGPVRFSDGIVLAGLKGEFVIFGMVSDDGKPLAASSRIKVWSGWNNLNTGYEIDPAMLKKRGFAHPGDKHNAVRKKGHPPIIPDVVPYTLHFPRKMDYRFEAYDFALRKCRQAAGKDTNEFRGGDPHAFMGVLHVTSHGAAVETKGEPVEITPAAEARSAAHEVRPQRAPRAEAGEAYMPLPGLSWADTAHAAERKLYRAKWASRASGETRPDGTARMSLQGARVLFDTPADVQIAFERNRMRRIAVSFAEPPALTDVIAAYTKRFGPPAAETLATHPHGTSKVVWRTARLAVTVTDHQGSMAIVFERGR